MGVLAGKTALVTGGTGGIGSAICARFEKEGAEVIAADIAEHHGAVPNAGEFVHFDVTDEARVIATFEDIAKRWDKLDILVNAAGIEIEETIENTTLEQWNRIFAINVTGMFLTSKYALPLLRKSGAQNSNGASVINFGSYDGYIADPCLAAYCATKGAVHALTKAMACDHGPEGIRVNAICPGFIDTPMLEAFFVSDGNGGPEQSREAMEKAARDAHPLRTYGQPEDIANLVNWLASDEARYASGQLWVIDGGLSAQVQQMRV